MSESFEPKLTELKIGYTFDYNLKTWIVEEVYHYKWGNNFSSVEYKIYSGDEEAYLEVEDDGILKILFSKDIDDIYLSPSDFTPYGNPKPTIGYKGKTYTFNEKFESQARNDEDDYWESFYLWDYYDNSGEEFISVENWDGDIEACHGHRVNELEISNITPGDPNRVRERNLKRKMGFESSFDGNSEENPAPVKIILFMVILVIFIIVTSRGCTGGGTYIHTGGVGRYNHFSGGGGSSWSGGGGGFRGGGGGFGK